MSYHYSVTVRHPGLGKCRVITGTIESVVDAKARAQLLEWEHKFQEQAEKERQRADRESRRLEESEKKQEAAERTEEARERSRK